MPVTRTPVLTVTPDRARTGGERHREIARVDVTIGRQPHGGAHTGRIEAAVKQLMRPVGADHLEGQTEGAGPAGEAAKLVDSLGRRRQPE